MKVGVECWREQSEGVDWNAGGSEVWEGVEMKAVMGMEDEV